MGDFVISDTHFGHGGHDGTEGILKYTDRGFATIKEHDDYIIEMWNKTVSHKDRTIIVGDFAWKNHAYYLDRLNGKKVLVIGSHDKMSQMDRQLFSEIHELYSSKILEHFFVFSHCAMRTWERKHYGSINIHGHSHGRLPPIPEIRQMDVSVDVLPNMAPLPIEYIIWRMDKIDYRNEPDHLAHNDRYVRLQRDFNLNDFNQYIGQLPERGDK